MTSCMKGDRILEVLMSTEATERDRREALEHAAQCVDCAELRELHEQLERVDLPDPAAEDLVTMRREVLDTLRGEASRREPTSAWHRIRLVLPGSLPRLVAAGAAGLALLALGFFVGRARFPASSLERAIDRTSIAGQVEYAAARAATDLEGGKSPFEYSHVRLREVDAGTVRLSFDVATHLDLVRSKDDPLVTEVLIQSLLSRESVGTKLDAIETAVTIQPRVREALIASMLGDETLAVRLKAISRLTADSSRAGMEPAVQEALLEVLRSDASVQMRILAIDYLTLNSVPPEALRQAVEQGRPEPGTAILVRADKYLKALS